MAPRPIGLVATLCCAGLLIVATPRSAIAAEIADIEFPNQLSADGAQLSLNGVGLRTAIFGIRVYAMALYLEAASKDPITIITSRRPKRLVLHFLRDLDADDLQEAWQEGFEKNVESVAAIQPQIDRFKAAMTDVREGDWMVIDHADDTINVTLNDTPVARIEGARFATGLLSVWLGPEPPNDHLKAGLLGEPH